MIETIRYQLANIANLNGRDARQTFWYFVAFLMVAQFFIGMVSVVPFFINIFTATFEGIQSGAPEAAVEAGIFEETADYIRAQMWVSLVTSILVTVLLIAPFVRRLHDAGYSGWIVVFPALSQLGSSLYTWSYLDRIDALMREAMVSGANGMPTDPFAIQAEMGWMSLIGWIGPVIVIGFGVLKSVEGPNAYGEGPTRF